MPVLPRHLRYSDPRVKAKLMAAPRRSEAFVDRFFEEAHLVVKWELGERVWRAAGNGFSELRSCGGGGTKKQNHGESWRTF